MKAIETQYRGQRFRSRTEALWAVAFHVSGIEYVYEKEGYDLRGNAYLPDFWLAEPHWWIEIKATEPNERECELARLLMLESGCDTFIFCGRPANVEYGGFSVWTFPALSEPRQNERGQKILEELADLLSALRIGVNGEQGTPEEEQQVRQWRWKLMGDFYHGLNVARQMRFEHDEREKYWGARGWQTSTL